FSLLFLLAGCGDDTPPIVSFTSSCTPTEGSAEAKQPTGAYPGHAGAHILVDGRALTPAGTQHPLGGFPLAMRFVGGGTRFLVVTDGAEAIEPIRVVDTQSGQVVASEPYSGSSGLFYGLAVSADGLRLYASGGGQDVVHVHSVDGTTGALTA